MSTRKEKLSAFLDNDMHRDELMSFSLSGEDEDARIAQRYQMIGDGLRGELSEASFVDVSAAVREAIAHESHAGESLAGQGAAAAQDKPVARDENRADSLFDLSRWLQPLAGMAVAASVAMVMVVTFSSQQSGSSLQAPLAQQAVDNAATMAVVSGTIPPAAVRAVSNRQNASNPGTPNPYINQHLEYVNQDSLQGRLPYVRAVSYESRTTARPAPEQR